MANTICLSTDMRTLYVINSSGTSTSYSLLGNGVDITLDSNNDVRASLASKPATGTTNRYDTNTARYTVLFNEPIRALEFIGVETLQPTRSQFTLVNNTVNIARSGNDLVVTD